MHFGLPLLLVFDFGLAGADSEYRAWRDVQKRVCEAAQEDARERTVAARPTNDHVRFELCDRSDGDRSVVMGVADDQLDVDPFALELLDLSLDQ